VATSQVPKKDGSFEQRSTQGAGLQPASGSRLWPQASAAERLWRVWRIRCTYQLAAALAGNTLPSMDTKPLRSRLPINLIIGLVFVFIVGVGFYVATTPAPAIVRDLRDLPELARVDFTGPEDPALAVVHIRDLHLPPKELAAVDGLDYPTLLRQVCTFRENLSSCRQGDHLIP
jgi:hypothetical protein